MINTQIGSFTIIKPTNKRRNDKSVVYKCSCVCGKIKYKAIWQMKRTKSCGCQTKYHSKYKDIKGKRTGRLIAIKSLYKNKYRNMVWECLCDCGKIIQLTAGLFNSGKQISCGCFHRENSSKRMQQTMSKPEGVSITNNLFANYKISAKNRNLVFKISFRYFKQLIQEPCFYCGEIKRNKRFIKQKCRNFEFTYNGIDRVNNNLGYIKTNVVSCCGFCNSAKSDLAQSEFLNWVKQLWSNLQKKNLLAENK